MKHTPPAVAVWDRPVRLLHWALVAAVTIAWLSTLGLGIVAWHEPAGHLAWAVVAARLCWGFAGGNPYGRFSQFVRGPTATWRYARALRRGHEPRHVGHNPLGGWMVLALLACVAAAAFTGWLYTTDTFWGYAWLDTLHRALAWLLLALIGAHLAGVAFTSWRHRENLVKAMISGRKPAPGPGDIT